MKKTFKKLVGISTAVAMCASLLPATAFAEETMSVEATEKPANENLLRIWYDEPAADWQTEALAIGNGYMGGLVFGGIAKDKIHINEKTVWNGGPTEENNYNYGNTNPTETEADLEKIKGDLNAIREKLDDKSEYVFGFDEDSYQSQGTNTKGEAMDWLNKLMGDLNGYDAPEDYANIYISSDIEESQVTNYVRDLDMRTALATVNYDYEGVHYTREYFNSYPDNALVVRLTADEQGKIDFQTNLENCMTGVAPSNVAEGDTITMKDTLATNGLKTEAQLKVLNEGGELTTDGTSIQVSGADAATLILACGTDYKMEFPKFRGEDPHQAVTQRIVNAAEKVKNQGYDVLKQAHVADHSALFSRMELGFNEEIPQIPTDELIKKYRNLVEGNGGEIPTEAEQRALEVICYQFGRYLTIAGSREGSLPTNLQGVWGEGSFMWYGDYHFNINVQMNYWPTMASNLKECLLPYNDFLSVLRQAGREAAAASFGIKSEEGEENGWLVGCFSTPYMFASMGQKNNAAGWNPIGSAWALLNSYEYYLYTEDVDFLKALYPSMKEVANFWNEALYWSEYQQRYVSAPSYSPENGPIVNGASYDQQFIWQHFENTIQAAKTLGVDEDLVKQWEEKQSKLDPVLVGKDGQVKEWFEETSIGKAQAGDLAEIDIPQWRESLGADSDGEQPPHRHLSHLMALYPCNIINKDNPEFMDAAIVSLNERGLDATGWSKAHKLNLWARTGHEEEAFQIVQSAVGGGNSGFLTNLFSSHGAGQDYKEKPIFQIDGNFGYTAGVNEMLLQSQLGYVQFLPTLPEQWKTGFVNGIVARGNFEIDMKWTDGIADSFVVTSNNGGEFVGEYANLSQYVVVDSQGNVVPTTKQSNDKIAFQTQAGETYTISKNGTSEITYPVKIEATEHGTVSIPQEAYQEGEEVYLTVIPEEGYKVEQVVVTDKEGNEIAVEEVKDSEKGNYRFKMPASEVTVKAVFEKMEAPSYPVKIEATEHGTVSISQEAYHEGEEVYLTVIPNEGYKVEQVVATDKEGNEIAVEEVKDSEEGNYRFKMPASEVTVKAVFEKMEAPTYPVKIEVTEHGTVSIPQEAYQEGEEVYLTVIPEEGYKVEQVVATDKEGNEIAVEEVKDSEEGNYRFKMPASEVTVKAAFEKMEAPTYPVKIEVTEHGTVSISQEAYQEGEEVYLTVIPDEGYKVEQVVVTDKEGKEVAVEEVKDSEEGNYRFKMPASEVTVKAVFEKMEAPSYPVKVEVTEHGTVSIPQEAYQEGEEVYMMATPEEGYKVEQVVVTDKEGNEIAVEEVKDSEEGNYRFKMPASEVMVKAVFEKMEAPTYPVKVEVTEHGTVSIPQEAYQEGEEVYLTVIPDEGYKVEQVVATDKEGKEIAVEEVKDSEEGNYRFKMPASEVTVKAVFTIMDKPTDPNKPETPDTEKPNNKPGSGNNSGNHQKPAPQKPSTNTQNHAVKTGDNTAVAGAATLCLLAGGAVFLVFLRRRKQIR